jgi:hypothetical protein
VSSPAFKRELTALIADDLRAGVALRVADVIDRRLVHELVGRWDDLVDIDAITTVAMELRRTVRQRARRSKRTLHVLLGHQFVADLEAAMSDAAQLSRDAEDFIARLMERELVQSLMTDLTYTAIVSFNRRVNPLFGNLALLAVDTQIKSFIRMFMPMLQRQATAFLVDPKNRAMFMDFARAAMHLLLHEPLPNLLTLVAGGSDADAEAMIRKSLQNPQLRRLVREAALLLADAVLRDLGPRRIGTVVQLEDHAEWLAERLSGPLRAVLARPHIAAFIARELARASAPPSRPRGRLR